MFVLSFECPIKIWQDSASFQSVILQDALPFNESFLGSHALVKGFGKGFQNLPLHKLNLDSELVSGEVVVTLSSQLPIHGITLLLGNELAGGRVHATLKVTLHPQVVDVPNELGQKYPDIFPVCAVTHAMTRQEKNKSKMFDLSVINLSDTFMAKGNLDLTGFGKTMLSHDQLVSEQRADPTICTLFTEAVSEDAITEEACGYFLSNGVLMKKWTAKMSSQDDWSSVFQIAIPSCFRTEILHLDHDHCLSGHLGIRKSLLRHFYWPGVKSHENSKYASSHLPVL